MAKTTRIHDIEKAVYLGRINTPFVAIPHTQIYNEQGQPRKIADLSQNLKASMGVERIAANSISLLTKEFGPNGESVYELPNKDPRVRFVGDWASTSGTGGSVLVSNTVDSFIEVTFYGTGLNALVRYTTFNRDFRVSVDGGAESGNVYPQGLSDVLDGRSYEANGIVPLTSGLSLGWHTVKIRNNVGNNIYISGIEILNESTQVVVNQGQPFQGGLNAALSVQSLLDYKPSSLTGTKGGRVITYLDENGNLGTASTVVDPSVTTGSPTELVTNGTFNSDISGWTNYGGASWNAGKLRITASMGTRIAEQAITTVIGLKYTLNLDYDNITNPAGVGAFVAIYTGVNATGSNLGSDSTGTGLGAGTLSVTFTATTTTTYIYVSLGDNNDVADFDNISVKETAYGFLALGDTNHSNEEITRKINFREFGRNRADDLSTISGNTAVDRAFTLDDGTTTFVGRQIGQQSNNGVSVITMEASGNAWNLTFVGTGLDIVMSNISYTGLCGVFVDGTSVGTINDTYTNKIVKISICSGLPYGTHTVKFNNDSLGGPVGGFAFSDFIIYQPKKPAIPENAIEIADYNVMADYVANVTSGYDTGSTGILRKSSIREFLYSGTWATPVVDTGRMNGLDFRTNTTNSYLEYTFFGTGVDLRFSSAAGMNATVLIDGSSDLSIYTTSSYSGGVMTFVAATGVISGEALNAGAIVSGLPIGLHTVRITVNNTVSFLIGGIDIITPIHFPNTKVGSQSIGDLRYNDIVDSDGKKVDLSRAKAWVIYDQANNIVHNSYNVSAVLEEGNFIHVYFKKPFTNNKIIMNTGVGGFNNASGDIGAACPTVIQPNHVKLWITQNHIGTSGLDYIALTFFGELENEVDINLEDL